MELYHAESGYEKFLKKKAAEQSLPIGGAFELLPICNMNCNMCYIRNNEPGIQSKILSGKDWISFGEKARDAGVLFLQITGGEPLLHPDFREIYLACQKMGFILIVNTNGTLIDEEWADFFAAHPCRRLNISLYGSSGDTYGRLCHHPEGFERVMRALRMLKERKVPFRLGFSLTRENCGELEAMMKVAGELNVPVESASYMFPPLRKEGEAPGFEDSRLSPEEAARTRLKAIFLNHPEADRTQQARLFMEQLTGPVEFPWSGLGFLCSAGRTGFWVNWKGELSPCGMIPEPKGDLTRRDFLDCWREITEKVSGLRTCTQCRTCRKKSFCASCAAACLTESGKFSGCPEYLCQMTDAMVHEVLTWLPEEERAAFQKKYDALMDAGEGENPQISIVVPVYNVEKYLNRCIDSILVQSFRQFELILVDDGSTDRSGEICDDYARIDARVRVIHQENKGVSAARNAGIRAARAPYLMFSDSDDVNERDWCLKLYQKILEHPDAFVMCNVWAGDEETPRKVTIGVELPNPDQVSADEFKNIAIFAYVWNKIYRTDTLRENEVSFDESISYNEDNKFNLEYMKYCQKGVYLTDPLCIHLIHEEGLAVKGMKAAGQSLSDIDLSKRGRLVKVQVGELWPPK